MMTRKEYKKRAGALRKLMRAITPQSTGRMMDASFYNFGATKRSDTGLWHIYNCVTNNCIGTVKFTGDRAIIRYRKKSYYSGVLKTFQYPLHTMIAVESSTLGHRSRWVREQLQSGVGGRFRSLQRSVERLADIDGGMRVVRSRPARRSIPIPRATSLTINGRNTRVRQDRNGRWRDARGRFIRHPLLSNDATYNVEMDQMINPSEVFISPNPYSSRVSYMETLSVPDSFFELPQRRPDNAPE